MDYAGDVKIILKCFVFQLNNDRYDEMSRISQRLLSFWNDLCRTNKQSYWNDIWPDNNKKIVVYCWQQEYVRYSLVMSLFLFKTFLMRHSQSYEAYIMPHNQIL